MGNKSKKSWREKLHDSKDLPKVEEIGGNMSQKWGTGTLVIPAPIEVDELMRSVPYGKLTTINQIRKALATKHDSTIACPITTGIFAWIAANAAQEAAAEGQEDFTPYWRTLKSGGELNDKYPGGVEAQASFLTQEGHAIEAGRGKKPPRVRDFERYLVDL